MTEAEKLKQMIEVVDDNTPCEVPEWLKGGERWIVLKIL